MKCLDELSSSARGEITGKDMDRPPVASPAMADQAVPLSNPPWASFDAPWETLVYLGPFIRWEQETTLSEFTSHSWDLLLGAPLRAIPPTSVLRQCIQMPCCLDTELNFVVDFCLPSPVANSQPLRLPDGRWELGTSIKMAMVRSLAQIVTS